MFSSRQDLWEFILCNRKSYHRQLKANDPKLFKTIKDAYTGTKNIGENFWLYCKYHSFPLQCNCGKKLLFENVIVGYKTLMCKRCYTVARRQESCLERTLKSQMSAIKPKCNHPNCNNSVRDNKNGTWSKYCSMKCVGRANSLTSRKKAKETLKGNYGVEHALQDKSIISKMHARNLAKWGVKNPMQVKEVRDKLVKTNLTIYNRENPSQKHITLDSIEKIKDCEWLTEACKTKTTQEIAALLGVSISITKVFRQYNIQPQQRGSALESQVMEFLQLLGIIIEVHNRQIIAPYELDIYLPEHKIAIECNGSYWHAELQGKGNNYHLNKTKLCEIQGIQLIHLWEHEWYDNNVLIKNRLLAKLGKSDKIYARKTVLKHIGDAEMKVFLNTHHIQGHATASVRLGLYYNDQLCALMTFGKSRFKKDVEWELIRYCSNGTVVGGASKLFKRFCNECVPKTVISYSDKAWNSGSLYKTLGFKYSHTSKPSYYYTLDYCYFENRVAYQKHKLSKKIDYFDPSLTEWQNMKNNGYDRIWDCGSDVWVYEIKHE